MSVNRRQIEYENGTKPVPGRDRGRDHAHFDLRRICEILSCGMPMVGGGSGLWIDAAEEEW